MPPFHESSFRPRSLDLRWNRESKEIRPSAGPLLTHKLSCLLFALGNESRAGGIRAADDLLERSPTVPAVRERHRLRYRIKRDRRRHRSRLRCGPELEQDY